MVPNRVHSLSSLPSWRSWLTAFSSKWEQTSSLALMGGDHKQKISPQRKTCIRVVLLVLLFLVPLLVLHFRDENRIVRLMAQTMAKSIQPTVIIGPRHQTLDTCIRAEFAALGSELDELVFNGRVETFDYVLIAATNRGYAYAKQWMRLRTLEGIPFVYFGTKMLRNGELKAYFGRLPALLAARACLPNSKYLVYTDVDTLIDWRETRTVATMSSLPLSITWRPTKYRKNGLEMRTNFFLVRAQQPRAVHVLRTWFYLGRHARIEDQTIFNELYAARSWFRDLTHLIPRENLTQVELHHCGSFVPDRKGCMRSMENWSEQFQKRIPDKYNTRYLQVR